MGAIVWPKTRYTYRFGPYDQWFRPFQHHTGATGIDRWFRPDEWTSVLTSALSADKLRNTAKQRTWHNFYLIAPDLAARVGGDDNHTPGPRWRCLAPPGSPGERRPGRIQPAGATFRSRPSYWYVSIVDGYRPNGSRGHHTRAPYRGISVQNNRNSKFIAPLLCGPAQSVGQ